MFRFFRKWYHRYIMYKVTMKYLSHPNVDPTDIEGIENIDWYVKNIVIKSGRLKKESEPFMDDVEFKLLLADIARGGKPAAGGCLSFEQVEAVKSIYAANNRELDNYFEHCIEARMPRSEARSLK